MSDSTYIEDFNGETIVSIEVGQTWIEIVLEDGRTISIKSSGGGEHFVVID